jgi:hypothetical protein
VEAVTGKKLDMPPQIQKVMGGTKVKTRISTYQDLKSYLVSP